jgi:hypothetical protein
VDFLLLVVRLHLLSSRQTQREREQECSAAVRPCGDKLIFRRIAEAPTSVVPEGVSHPT